jgi:hypothetical protein
MHGIALLPARCCTARWVGEETGSAKPNATNAHSSCCSSALLPAVRPQDNSNAAISRQAGGCGTQARTAHPLCNPPFQSRQILLDPSLSNPSRDWSLTSSSATSETVPLTRGCYRFFPSHILVHSANSNLRQLSSVVLFHHKRTI